MAARLNRGDDLAAYRTVLRTRSYRREAAAQGLERLGEWAYTIGMVVLAYGLTGSAAAVALLVLAHVVPRLQFVLAGQPLRLQHPQRVLRYACLARVPLVVVFLAVGSRADIAWAALVALALGLLAALSDAARGQLLQGLVERKQLATVNMLTGRIEQACLLVGALVAAVLLLAWGTVATFVAAAGLLLGAAALRLGPDPAAAGANRPQEELPRASAWRVLRNDRTQRMLLTGLIAGAVLAMSLRVLLIDVVVSRHGYSEALYAGLLAVVGVGALAGPIPIARLLGKTPAPFAALALVLALAGGVALLSLADVFILVAPLLFLSGLLAITNDLVTTTVMRRLARPELASATFALLGAAVVVGQVVALVAVLGLTPWLEATEVLLLASAGCALAAALVWSRGPTNPAPLRATRRTTEQR